MNSRIDFQSSLCHISVAVVMDTEKKKKKPTQVKKMTQFRVKQRQ